MTPLSKQTKELNSVSQRFCTMYQDAFTHEGRVVGFHDTQVYPSALATIQDPVGGLRKSTWAVVPS